MRNIVLIFSVIFIAIQAFGNDLIQQGRKAMLKGDYLNAKTLFLDAAKQGKSEALYELGEYYSLQDVPESDLSIAFDYYKKAADLDNSSGINELAKCYLKGWGVTKSYTEAIKLYNKLITQNNAYGYAGLGELYMLGWGVEKNHKKAFELFLKAINLYNNKYKKYLNPLVRNHVGSEYLFGRYIPQDFEKAREQFLIVAREQQNYEMLGIMAWFGLDCPVDRQRADLLFKSSRGYNKDDVRLLIDYHEQKFRNNLTHKAKLAISEERYPEAISIYKKLIAQNNPDGFAGLGDMYLNAIGVERNREKAFLLYLKAIEFSSEAQKASLPSNLWKHVGDEYLFGKYVPQDFKKARKYYLINAKLYQDYIPLAAMAEQGLGQSVNLELARIYFKASNISSKKFSDINFYHYYKRLHWNDWQKNN